MNSSLENLRRIPALVNGLYWEKEQNEATSEDWFLLQFLFTWYVLCFHFLSTRAFTFLSVTAIKTKHMTFFVAINLIHKTWGSSKSSTGRNMPSFFFPVKWFDWCPMISSRPAPWSQPMAFIQRSRRAAVRGSAPLPHPSVAKAFPESRVRTAVLWPGSWRPCGLCSGRNGTSWAVVGVCTLWHGGPNLHSYST